LHALVGGGFNAGWPGKRTTVMCKIQAISFAIIAAFGDNTAKKNFLAYQ
jgi:hypothetical protein